MYAKPGTHYHGAIAGEQGYQNQLWIVYIGGCMTYGSIGGSASYNISPPCSKRNAANIEVKYAQGPKSLRSSSVSG